MKKTFLLLSAFLLISIYSNSQTEAPCFTAFKTNPSTAVLPDYSYAGYHSGADSIPDVNLPIFDVTKYGALPNDDLEDFDGVQAAITAAVAAGGGIVFFPGGRFLMNEQTTRTTGILIEGQNVILRGSGSGVGGTELFIRNHFVSPDPTCLYCTPPLFTFYKYLGEVKRTTLALDVKRGDKEITVVDASTFRVGNMIKLASQKVAANNELLCGLTPYPEWTTTVNSGILFAELHKITAINGNVITFGEPININMTALNGWNVKYIVLAQGNGVEDLWFHGNFQEVFVHHLNYIHDSGWSGIAMNTNQNAFIRRLRFTDMNIGAGFSSCFTCTALHIRFDGNPGHFLVETSNGSYGTLLGYIDDRTNSSGQFHGPGPSSSSSGCVLWRYRGGVRSGPDFHASYPYCNLIDACNCRYIGNGGDAAVLPNHGKDLTYWKTKEIGATANIAFWENHVSPPYGNFAKIVYPNVVGWQGGSTFNTTTLGLYESYGNAVLPESLYEGQLAFRLGSLPSWIYAAKNVWTNYLITGQWPTNRYSKSEMTQIPTSSVNATVIPIEGGFTLSVNGLQAHYEIFSITGKFVLSGELFGYSQDIFFKGSKHGLYLLFVKMKDGMVTKKLVF